MKLILATTSSFSVGAALEAAGYRVETNPFKRKLTEQEVLDLVVKHKPVGLFAGVEPLTRRVLEAGLPSLRVVSRCGVGLDTVDLAAAEQLGIAVYNTPDAPSPAVAELTLALMLAVLRKVPQADASLRAGKWQALQGRLLAGKTVGVVGMGRIGARVAELCRAFGCRVLACDPRPGFDGVPLPRLLAEADVVTLHLPLLAQTRHGIDPFAMKKGAVLINCSRGGLVDEAALEKALREGHLAGAGLDVFEQEPYAGPLRELPQVVMTCHMGSAAEECRARMEREAADNLISHLGALEVA